jgi:hypothetical protein
VEVIKKQFPELEYVRCERAMGPSLVEFLIHNHLDGRSRYEGWEGQLQGAGLEHLSSGNQIKNLKSII